MSIWNVREKLCVLVRLLIRHSIPCVSAAILLLLLPGSAPLFCQDDAQQAPDLERPWDFHAQATVIPQGHGDFRALYSGLNSLSPDAELDTSFTSTFYVGRRLWEGGEIYVNPEILAGKGLSSTLGLAGFPNGEIYRVDNPNPKLTLARLFLRQTWQLGGPEETLKDDLNQFPCRCRSSRITLVVGKFALVDLFDDNAYSHDARTQFLNWSLMDNGAWDFAADTRGYTYGVAVEAAKARWSLRFASVLMPKVANGMALDLHPDKARADNLEWERRHKLAGRPGALRLMAYINHGHMGNYRTTLETPAYGMDITRSRTYTRKYGFGLNGEQELARGIGVFFRAGWNDGHTESFAFTEIDRTGAGGISINGSRWNRRQDTFAVALALNGISKDHREYLQAGGHGFIIGDGALNYGKEGILETYYSFAARWGVFISPDFQFVEHPAYNRDRGPVAVYALRFHWER